ncbi:hypothetical protein HPB50_001162 [Hyalomma asiaticum]|uniref:Uncharacterized protein n=1 Tax=Hyalomma asiaticum TaxID=266040 RepID=A0ACB7TCM8_HYAAI|nr:hypothetical protein HPB50_001162 [Hyalomma asiaticum]
MVGGRRYVCWRPLGQPKLRLDVLDKSAVGLVRAHRGTAGSSGHGIQRYSRVAFKVPRHATWSLSPRAKSAGHALCYRESELLCARPERNRGPAKGSPL